MTITLATLNTATAQEVYDQVVAHLRKQQARSVGFKLHGVDGTACAYRGDGGMMCAAGCLISDEEYDREAMEGYPWDILVDRQKVPSAHERLIQELQTIHDVSSVEKWEMKFEKTARDHRLIYTEPLNANHPSNAG